MLRVGKVDEAIPDVDSTAVAKRRLRRRSNAMSASSCRRDTEADSLWARVCRERLFQVGSGMMGSSAALESTGDVAISSVSASSSWNSCMVEVEIENFLPYPGCKVCVVDS